MKEKKKHDRRSGEINDMKKTRSQKDFFKKEKKKKGQEKHDKRKTHN